MPANQSKPETIDEYLADLPADARRVLGEVREAIEEAAPEAEGTISYGIPLFRLGGRHLIGFGAARNHLSLFVTEARVLREYERELAPFDHAGTKTTVRFTVDNPLPKSLVRKIVETRAAHVNDELRGGRVSKG